MIEIDFNKMPDPSSEQRDAEIAAAKKAALAEAKAKKANKVMKK